MGVGELYIQGIERQRGETFSTGEAVGGPKSYDSTETVLLYILQYTILALAPRWARGRKTFLFASQNDGNWRALRSIQRVRLARGVGTQRPFLHVNQPKKTGARSARARTRGQNPLVYHIFTLSYIYLGYFVCLCVIVCVCVTIAERTAILLVFIIKLTKEARWMDWRWRY